MSERGLGQYLDQLGIVCDLSDQDAVMDAIVLLRLSNLEDGETRYALAYSRHTDFIIRRGMVEIAKDFEEMNSVMAIDDDEDGAL